VSGSGSRGGGGYLPKWVRNLEEHAGWLTSLAQNPVGTLRSTVRTILSVILVGGIIDMGQSIVNAILAVGEALLAIPESVLALLTGAGDGVAKTVLAAGGWYLEVIGSTAASMGPLGIFVQIGAYALTVVLLIRALPPLMTALSDLLGAVPVVGSILDAVLTFAIEFASSLSGLVGGSD